MTPFTRADIGMGNIFRWRKNRKKSDVNAKREAMSISALIPVKPIFIATNVLPQIKVVVRRKNSAFALVIIVLLGDTGMTILRDGKHQGCGNS